MPKGNVNWCQINLTSYKTDFVVVRRSGWKPIMWSDDKILCEKRVAETPRNAILLMWDRSEGRYLRGSF